MTIELPAAEARSSRPALDEADDVNQRQPPVRRSRVALVSGLLLTITCVLMVFPLTTAVRPWKNWKRPTTMSMAPANALPQLPATVPSEFRLMAPSWGGARGARVTRRG